jgi:predicted ATP-dependent endonuclease of OLD family
VELLLLLVTNRKTRNKAQNMSTEFNAFRIQRYRSILDLNFEIKRTDPLVICGENNIGKTNVLRALNLLFNHLAEPDLFRPSEDIPHHIFYGSRGAGAKTELTGDFSIDGRNHILLVRFSQSGKVTYRINGKRVDQEMAEAILSRFKYYFIESNNINIPNLISGVLENEGFLPLDTKRSKQSRPLEKLREFIDLSQEAINGIELSLNKYFEELTDFEGILRGRQVKINFAEYNKLREVLRTMTSITLFDGNNHGIASKGSGVQRAVFISLMRFIASNTKKKPALQKKVFSVLKETVSHHKQPVILTSHSQHFIDLTSLDNTHLLEGQVEERTYTRKPGQIFHEVSTKSIARGSPNEKASAIRKHLGILSNDGWVLMPYNIIVEGDEDKRYLEIIFNALSLPSPNILAAGGASKIAGYLQFFNSFAGDLSYKPVCRCIFDNDEEGRDQHPRVKQKSCPNLIVQSEFLPRYDGVTAFKGNGNWEIEDYLPPELMIKCANILLRKEGYEVITEHQKHARGHLAHQNKQILRYVEECCSANNSGKLALSIDNNQGRKLQLCRIFGENISPAELISVLTPEQKDYLERISNP